MTNGCVYGDFRSIGTETGGDDNISITTMEGGTIFGDAYFIQDTGSAGNDIITVDHMLGGTIYADG